jgi:hypothetical protein
MKTHQPGWRNGDVLALHDAAVVSENVNERFRDVELHLVASRLAEVRRGHERFDRPEHLFGMRSEGNPAGKAILDIDFVVEETGCGGADLGDGVDLLADERLHQSRGEFRLLIGGERSLGAVDSDERHGPISLRVMG